MSCTIIGCRCYHKTMLKVIIWSNHSLMVSLSDFKSLVSLLLASSPLFLFLHFPLWYSIQQLYCQYFAVTFLYSNQKSPTSSLKFLLVRPYEHRREGQWAWHWHSPSFEDVHKHRGTGSYRGRSCAQACFESGHSGMRQVQRETIGGSTSIPETDQAWQSLCESVSFYPLHLSTSFCLCCWAEQWLSMNCCLTRTTDQFTCDSHVCVKFLPHIRDQAGHLERPLRLCGGFFVHVCKKNDNMKVSIWGWESNGERMNE